MNLFLATQEIDYATAEASVVSPYSVAQGSRGATSVLCMPTYGSVGSPYMTTWNGNFLLNTSMIVDMGERPLVLPNGMESRVLASREAMREALNLALEKAGMD